MENVNEVLEGVKESVAKAKEAVAERLPEIKEFAVEKAEAVIDFASAKAEELKSHRNLPAEASEAEEAATSVDEPVVLPEDFEEGAAPCEEEDEPELILGFTWKEILIGVAAAIAVIGGIIAIIRCLTKKK